MVNPFRKKHKVVFLYTEFSGYTLSSIKKLVENYNVDVHIIKWAINKEAPFQFEDVKNVTIYSRNNYSKKKLLDLVNRILPDIIIASGWIDKYYLEVCKCFFNKIPTVLTLDNQWTGTIRQRIAAVLSPVIILNKFSHAWVLGKSQFQYARKLGFDPKNIFKGYYSADYDFFFNQYQNNKLKKQENCPKKFIYIGRYIEHKGIKDLWQAFIELSKENENDWELWCLGTGELYEQRIEHEKIKHFGFVQPKEIENFIRDTSVFVLPSHFEPWGVVVHEFASAGFPMICSEEVGATEVFLEHGVNGYIYKTGDVMSLKNALQKIMNHTDKELLKMGEKSVEKSKLITPEKWAKTLMSIIESEKKLQ